MSDHDRKRLFVLPDEGQGGPGAPGPGTVDRRRFLALMGASLALAKTGCTRQPPEAIVPYVQQPEEVVPGESQFYATSMLHRGYATGLLVRSVTGRPIKVEGNPDHPASLGATDVFAQALPLSLYDPTRSQVVTRLGRVTTWSRFALEIGRAVAAARAGGGAGIRVLSGAVTSPSLAAQIGAFLRDLPNARWCRYEPSGAHCAKAGARLAFGAPLDVRHDLARSDVILSIESDFLAEGPGAQRYAHDFASRRRGAGAAAAARGAGPGPAMNRLYSVESSPTCTGTIADHRLSVRPSDVGPFTLALATALGVLRDGAREIRPQLRTFAEAVARDLRAHAGRSTILVGEPAPPAVHALAAAMNDALANTGATLTYSDPVEADPVDDLASLRDLAAEMHRGAVSVLVILGGNPAYSAPADIDFAGAMTKVPFCAHLSLYADETSERSHFHVPEAHPLESWGDGRAFDGTISLVQPLIDPLYGSRTAAEVLAAMQGTPAPAALDLLRDHYRDRLGDGDFEAAWRKALSDGFVRGSALPARGAPIAVDAAQRAAADLVAAMRDSGGYELAVRPDPTVDDGRFAENGWLQELPKPRTKLTWENAALLSPATATELDVTDGDVVELAREGRATTAPVVVVPGHPDSTVTVHLGYGRSRGGPVAVGLGFDAGRLRTSVSPWHGPGLVIRKTGERRALAITQGHFRLEGRPIARHATLDEVQKNPDVFREMGEEPPRALSLYPEWLYPGRAWGMAVDLSICTGCSSCVIACQAENNIPVVGKEQVERGREMHWLRIDTYDIGAAEAPLVVNQPMMCQHCEHAPCEYVCPVEATSHSAEGLNEMTYNRCVGTRYCSNNCPYKVRRFNFFEYHPNVSNTERLLYNPDVTVRSRGVMEKCTYCVQRIAAARIPAESEGRPIRDGEVVTACQQACPTGAIVFGDIHDPGSQVHRLHDDPRSYGVLAELQTNPRTRYLGRIRNPNPELEGHG
jgi:molybdopterin-containing oxidoreductase family iron-sulfur binding subunit